MRPRKSARAAFATLLVAVGLGAGGGTAHAAQQLTCTGAQTNTYNPGLRLLQDRDVTAGVDIQLGPCLSVTEPAITSGSVSGTFPARLSCTALLTNSFPGTLSSTYTWNDGRTSTFTYRADTEYAAGLLTVTSVGTITAGVFQGASATTVATVAALPSDCLTPTGLTQQQGLYTLLFTGLG